MSRGDRPAPPPRPHQQHPHRRRPPPRERHHHPTTHAASPPHRPAPAAPPPPRAHDRAPPPPPPPRPPPRARAPLRPWATRTPGRGHPGPRGANRARLGNNHDRPGGIPKQERKEHTFELPSDL